MVELSISSGTPRENDRTNYLSASAINLTTIGESSAPATRVF
jgi:hypothetical protein